jgi:acyl-CoA synthetase (AMP-forming)/AMP-acid ligase II
MSQARPIPLFERIKARCNSGGHEFLDLSASADAGRIEACSMLELAEQVASQLTRSAPNHLILIYLDQLKSFIPVLWGCLAARLTALPLPMAANPGPPKPSDLAQLEALLVNAGPVAVVIDEITATARSYLPELPNVRWLNLSGLLMGTANSSSESIAAKSSSIAFLIQTSGTTGLCKYAAFSDSSRIEALSNGRRVMGVLPLGSTNGMRFITALDQLSVYKPLREAMRHPGQLLKAVEKHQLDTLMLPPVMVKGLLRYFKSSTASTERIDLSSLAVLEIGSSTIALHEAEELSKYLEGWGAKHSLIRLVYGSTETGRLAYGDLRSAVQNPHCAGQRIGPIMRDVDVRILSESDGEPGEILVKRKSEFLGYIDPKTWRLQLFNNQKDWFHTGDTGLIDNGELILSGRSKDIIIVNSRKISLASIERYVEELFSSQLETVVACAGPQEELVIFVVPIGETSILPTNLEAEIANALGDQFGLPLLDLIPLSAAEIPRTPTGKIKKKELLGLWPQKYRHTGFQEASQNLCASSQHNSALELLQQLIEKQGWSTTPVDPDQPLTLCGLDSLTLVQLIGTAERQSGLMCRVDACPPNPTLRDLAILFEAKPPDFQPAASDHLVVDSSILDQYPHRQELINRIQRENMLLGGEVVGSHGVVRLFNANGDETPLVLIANVSSTWIDKISKMLLRHPIYFLRLSELPRNFGSRQYLASCCVDWLEACLPDTRPILIGYCLAGVIVRHVAQQLWSRPHRPLLTMLMDWNPGREDQMHPYAGSVLYHVYEWFWGRDPRCKETLQSMAKTQTPRAAFYFASCKAETMTSYTDFDSTVGVLAKILADPNLNSILDLDP